MRALLTYLTIVGLAIVAGGCRYAGWIGPRDGSSGVEWGHELQTDVRLAYDPSQTPPSDPKGVSP